MSLLRGSATSLYGLIIIFTVCSRAFAFPRPQVSTEGNSSLSSVNGQAASAAAASSESDPLRKVTETDTFFFSQEEIIEWRGSTSKSYMTLPEGEEVTITETKFAEIQDKSWGGYAQNDVFGAFPAVRTQSAAITIESQGTVWLQHWNGRTWTVDEVVGPTTETIFATESGTGFTSYGVQPILPYLNHNDPACSLIHDGVLPMPLPCDTMKAKRLATVLEAGKSLVATATEGCQNCCSMSLSLTTYTDPGSIYTTTTMASYRSLELISQGVPGRRCGGSCGHCQIFFSSVSVFYWPVSSANTACLTKQSATSLVSNLTSTKGAERRHNPQPRAEVSTVVDSRGFTFTSPSIYIVYPTLYAKDNCGTLGKTHTSMTIAYGPSDLSTALLTESDASASSAWVASNSELGIQGYGVDDELPPPLWSIYQPFNFADADCPPASLSTLNYWTLIGKEGEYNPLISAPPGLSNIDPAWAQLCTAADFQGQDPPSALTPAGNFLPTATQGESDPKPTPAEPGSTVTEGPKATMNQLTAAPGMLSTQGDPTSKTSAAVAPEETQSTSLQQESSGAMPLPSESEGEQKPSRTHASDGGPTTEIQSAEHTKSGTPQMSPQAGAQTSGPAENDPPIGSTSTDDPTPVPGDSQPPEQASSPGDKPQGNPPNTSNPPAASESEGLSESTPVSTRDATSVTNTDGGKPTHATQQSGSHSNAAEAGTPSPTPTSDVLANLLASIIMAPFTGEPTSNADADAEGGSSSPSGEAGDTRTQTSSSPAGTTSAPQPGSSGSGSSESSPTTEKGSTEQTYASAGSADVSSRTSTGSGGADGEVLKTTSASEDIGQSSGGSSASVTADGSLAGSSVGSASASASQTGLAVAGRFVPAWSLGWHVIVAAVWLSR